MQNFAFPYARASTDKQTLSVPAQLWAITERHKSDLERGVHKLPLHEPFIDQATTSGIPFFDRPYAGALNTRLQPGDVVYVAKQDRMFRNLREALNTMHEFQQRGVALVIMDNLIDLSTAAGRFSFAVLGAANQMEREYISIRTREALAQRKRVKGPIYAGAPPLGWRATKSTLGNRFIICEPERAFGLACYILKRQHGISCDTLEIVLPRLGFHGRAKRRTVMAQRFALAHEADYPSRGVCERLKDYEIARIEKAANHIVLRVLESKERRDRFWPSHVFRRPCFSTVSP